MTLKELKDRNPDIILEEMSEDDAKAGANGMAVFYASVRPGQKPKDERTILCAGYALTTGFFQDASGGYLNVLGLTARGNAKIDLVKLSGLGPSGNTALFRAAPVPEDDPRNLKPCSRW